MGAGYVNQRGGKKWQQRKVGRKEEGSDSTGIDLSYFCRVFCGVGSTSQSLRAQDGGRSRHPEHGASNVHSAGSSRRFARTFRRCSWVDGTSVYRVKVGAERQIHNLSRH